MFRSLCIICLGIGVAVALAGCSSTEPYAPSSYTPSYIPPSYSYAPKHRAKQAPANEENNDEDEADEETPAHPALKPPPQVAPAPTVTLADDPESEALANKLLDNAQSRLGSMNPSTLNPGDAVTYKQAEDFVSAGRQALNEKDYAAATGYAQKASVLANRLNTASR
jgi:hypothetical protein